MSSGSTSSSSSNSGGGGGGNSGSFGIVMTPIAILICSLQLYFILMNVTVERYYCHNSIDVDSQGFLIKETYEFSVENNPYFLQRPEWLRMATCVHSYIFWINYMLVFITTLFDLWNIPTIQMILLLFVGGKTYAIGFYHLMEFTSSIPPENLITYFGVEGPYIVSIGLVLWKILSATTTTTKTKLE